MAIWSAEIKEIEKLNESLKSQLPDLDKELERLIRADDENMILLYSRRCIEVIITDLCECELKRDRGTEPLKGIIDKLNKERKVPSHIITSMHGLNELSTYGAHPKEFDPQQVRPVLINLAIILNWYLKYHNIKSPEVEETTEKGKRPVEKKHNLPISTTSFIGREKEIKEVKELFQKSRLVTLTGAGGCGKTRLAREIASTLVEEYKDGVWFVNLAPVTDPGFVTKSITEVLNIKEEPDKPIIDTLINKIKDKSLLLLLDNCEHLVQICAEITDMLLHSVNGIRILATSREALNIPGEMVWIIPSLSFPAHGSNVHIDEFDRYESIKLFIDRAGSVQVGFKLNTQNVSIVAQICSQIEGIPLAIELAATRTRHLGPETILERLRDQFNILSSSDRIAPERQQTLKATIDWSYNLLSEQEQLLFNRLAVFTGDFSLDGAEEVCQDNKLLKKDILSLLSQLVDKSLIIANRQEDESVRYRYLEPIHQYSQQKLIDNKEEERFRKNHLDYYLKMVEKAYEEQYNTMSFWLTKLSKEHDNLLLALRWAENYTPNDFVLLSGALSWFWRMHSQIIIGTEYLKRAVTKNKERNGALARVLYGLGMLITINEGMTKGIEMLKKSLEIWRELNNAKEQSVVLAQLGLAEYANNYESGLKYCEESLELAKKTSDRGLINYITIYVCQGLVLLNYIDRAKPMAKQLLIDSKELYQPFGIMAAEHFLGDCALIEENFKEAEIAYAEAMKTGFQFGELFMGIQNMIGTAMSVSGQSRYTKAIRLNGAARAQASQLGIVIPEIQFWGNLINKYINGAKEKLTNEQVIQYEEEGKNMRFETAIEYALDFDRD